MILMNGRFCSHEKWGSSKYVRTMLLMVKTQVIQIPLTLSTSGTTLSEAPR